MKVKLLPSINLNNTPPHHNHSKEIRHYYDRQDWKVGETYRIRVSNIYDPSKFWVVLKERELDIFQRFLTDFYQKHGNLYGIPIDAVSKNTYCAAFVDNAFYRGLIVSKPHSISSDKKAVVYLFDFGFTSMINLGDLYYLAEKFYDVPRFAVRASLSYVQPYDENTWNNCVVKRFNELVGGKVLLCILECTEPSRKIIHIKLGSVNEFSDVTDISDILISEKLAKCLSSKKESPMKMKNCDRYCPKTKYPYLFPSFEAIEGGIVPSSVYASETLRYCVPTDVLFKPYFAYKGTSNT